MDIKTGIDIIEIDRIKRAAENPRFLERTLSEKEREYLLKKTGTIGGKVLYPFATLAGLYAAKEAISKALGVGLLREVGFADIEITHSQKGAPEVLLSAKAKALINGEFKASVSISHDAGVAIAACNIIIW